MNPKIHRRPERRGGEDEDMTGTVIAVCMSKNKGTQKTPVNEITLLKDWGIAGDAHAGKWHRQVSLLSLERIEEFRARGAEVEYGAFGENIVISGFDFKSYPVGTRFRIGNVILEMTQIGKECHTHCAIYQVMKDCIMPREGVFTRVLQGGVVRPGDPVEIVRDIPKNAECGRGDVPEEGEQRRMDRRYTAAVITISDKGSKGERKDTSGPEVCRILTEDGYDVVYTSVIPDDKERIVQELLACTDDKNCTLVVTTGGTGFSQRDITPEATLEILEKQTPGLPELMRAESMKVTPYGCLSRGVAGIRGKSLVLNLPGSEKAARENLEFILRPVRHGLKMLLSEGSSEHEECIRHNQY